VGDELSKSELLVESLRSIVELRLVSLELLIVVSCGLVLAPRVIPSKSVES